MAEEIISKHVEFFLAAGWNQLVPQKVKQPFACVVEPGEDNYSRGAENAKICGNEKSLDKETSPYERAPLRDLNVGLA
eukprot:g2175.t1